MEKGVYSAIIALMALVLAIAMIAGSNQKIAIENEIPLASTITAVKVEWQNARFALDKSLSDAIADFIVNEGCHPDLGSASLKSTIDLYFAYSAQEVGNDECTATIGSGGYVVAGNDVDVVATITCERQLGQDSSVKYGKEAVFKKEVSIVLGPPDTFTVTDLQSGIVEVSGSC